MISNSLCILVCEKPNTERFLKTAKWKLTIGVSGQSVRRKREKLIAFDITAVAILTAARDKRDVAVRKIGSRKNSHIAYTILAINPLNDVVRLAREII